MKPLVLAGLLFAFGLSAGAEDHRVFVKSLPPPPPATLRTGFGSVVFPGTGGPPARSPFAGNATFPDRLGATVSGFPPFTGAPAGPIRGRGRDHRGGGVVAVPYPVFVGGGGYYYPGAYDQAPDQPQPQQQPGVVVVYPPANSGMGYAYTPETARPMVREYGPGGQQIQPQESGVSVYNAPSNTPPSQSEDQVLFLIALKDSTVYSAVAYWVEGTTLHYITPQGKHNQVSLALVDRSVSDRLNQGRNVEFRLPAGG